MLKKRVASEVSIRSAGRLAGSPEVLAQQDRWCSGRWTASVIFSRGPGTFRKSNFLKGKLGLTEDDALLEAAIKEVGTLMSAERTKSRATVYYLLAEKFNKLDVFT